MKIHNKLYEYHVDSISMIHSVTIRKIQPSDLHQIVNLERKCFSEQNAYSQRQLKYLITKANSCCLAELQNGMIRGFIIVLFRKGTTVAGIETINVDPQYRGLGIGQKLITAAESEMYPQSIKRVRLEVSSGNISAIRLYEKLGFKKIALLENYYFFQYYGSSNAYRMIKDLAI